MSRLIRLPDRADRGPEVDVPTGATLLGVARVLGGRGTIPAAGNLPPDFVTTLTVLAAAAHCDVGSLFGRRPLTATKRGGGEAHRTELGS